MDLKARGLELHTEPCLLQCLPWPDKGEHVLAPGQRGWSDAIHDGRITAGIALAGWVNIANQQARHVRQPGEIAFELEPIRKTIRPHQADSNYLAFDPGVFIKPVDCTQAMVAIGDDDFGMSRVARQHQG